MAERMEQDEVEITKEAEMEWPARWMKKQKNGTTEAKRRSKKEGTD